MRRIAAISGAVILSITMLVMAPLGASTPDRAIIATPRDASPSTSPKQTITFSGGPLGPGVAGGTDNSGQDEAQTCASDCDKFTLDTAIPDSFWSDRHGHAHVKITWTDPATSDLDLYVFDSAGRLLGSSGHDLTTKIEELDLVDPATSFSIRTLNFNPVTVPSFQGQIDLFVDSLDPPPPTTSNDASITFAPATQVDPMAIGGEPGLNLDRQPAHGGRVFIDWPTGDPINQRGSLYRSDDRGDSFHRLEALPCTAQGRRTPSCLQSGGGDTETALSPYSDDIYFADQEVLVQEALAVSNDQGINWPLANQHALTNTLSGTDRQWLAPAKDPILGNIAYLAYHLGIGGGEVIQKVLANGTLVTPQPLPQVRDVGQSGPLNVDNTGGPHDGTMYFPYFARGVLRVATSTNRALTFNSVTVSASGQRVGDIDWLTIDSAGNVYVAYLEVNSGDVFMSTMKYGGTANDASPGSTWSTPVRVSAPPVNTAVFPAIAAGSPGHVTVAYYGTSSPGQGDMASRSGDTPDNVKPDARWSTYAAFSSDALCQWSGCSSPSFKQTLASHRDVHQGNVCTSGGGCSIGNHDDRSLLDFLDVGYDENGRVGIVWTDDNTDLDRNEQTDPGLDAFNGRIEYAELSTGPPLLTGKPTVAVADPVFAVDPEGDAIWPYFGPKAPGPNHPQLDIKESHLDFSEDSVTATLRLKDVSDMDAALKGTGRLDINGVPGDAVRALYIVTWHFGDNDFFLGAQYLHAAGTSPATTFFSGKLDANESASKENGDLVNAQTVLYLPDKPQTGSISGNTITITAPLSAIGSPKGGDRFQSVTSMSLTGRLATTTGSTTAPFLMDAAPPFDLTVAASKTTILPKLAATGAEDAMLAMGLLLVICGCLLRRYIGPTV